MHRQLTLTTVRTQEITEGTQVQRKKEKRTTLTPLMTRESTAPATLKYFRRKHFASGSALSRSHSPFANKTGSSLHYSSNANVISLFLSRSLSGRTQPVYYCERARKRSKNLGKALVRSFGCLGEPPDATSSCGQTFNARGWRSKEGIK